MVLLLEPLLLLVSHKELVELLTLELQLVLRVLFDPLLVRYGVILRVRHTKNVGTNAYVVGYSKKAS
jgi:hypothetical protein